MGTKPIWAMTGRTGELFKYKDLTFFACEGLIALHDERAAAVLADDTFTVLRPSELVERAKALRQFAKNTKGAAGAAKWLRQESQEYSRVARMMLQCVREARGMGDPSDPKVQAWWAKHRPDRKSRVALSAGSDIAGYPQLPEIPLGKDTGRRADPGASLPAARPTVHRKPTRKNRSGLTLDL